MKCLNRTLNRPPCFVSDESRKKHGGDQATSPNYNHPESPDKRLTCGNHFEFPVRRSGLKTFCSSMFACAAASRAVSSRNGEQET